MECTPQKGIFDFRGVTPLHERGFLSFVECIPFYFCWPTPRKGIKEFQGVHITLPKVLFKLLGVHCTQFEQLLRTLWSACLKKILLIMRFGRSR